MSLYDRNSRQIVIDALTEGFAPDMKAYFAIIVNRLCELDFDDFPPKHTIPVARRVVNFLGMTKSVSAMVDVICEKYEDYDAYLRIAQNLDDSEAWALAFMTINVVKRLDFFRVSNLVKEITDSLPNGRDVLDQIERI